MPQPRRPGKRLIGGMVGLAAVVAYLVGNRILSTEVGRHISGDAHCILRNQGSRVGDYTSYMWGGIRGHWARRGFDLGPYRLPS